MSKKKVSKKKVSKKRAKRAVPATSKYGGKVSFEDVESSEVPAAKSTRESTFGPVRSAIIARLENYASLVDDGFDPIPVAMKVKMPTDFDGSIDDWKRRLANNSRNDEIAALKHELGLRMRVTCDEKAAYITFVPSKS